MVTSENPGGSHDSRESVGGQRSGTPPSDVGVSIYDEVSLLRNVIFKGYGLVVVAGDCESNVKQSSAI